MLLFILLLFSSPLRRVAPSNIWQRPVNLLSSFMLSKTYSDSAVGNQSAQPPAIIESLKLDSSKSNAVTTYQLRCVLFRLLFLFLLFVCLIYFFALFYY